MQAAETPAENGTAEDALEKFIAVIAGTQAVAMGEKTGTSADVPKFALKMHVQPTFLGQVAVGPHVVVAREKVDGQSAVGPLRQATQQSGVAPRNGLPQFVPEIEDVAQQYNGFGFGRYGVYPVHQLFFAGQAFGLTGNAQVGIGHDKYGAVRVAVMVGIVQWPFLVPDLLDWR